MIDIEMNGKQFVYRETNGIQYNLQYKDFEWPNEY